MKMKNKKNKIVIVLIIMIFAVLSCTPNKKPVEQPPIEVVEPEEPYIGNIEIGVHTVRNITEIDDLVWFQWENNNGVWIYTRLPKRHVTYVFNDIETPTIEFRRNTDETTSENLISGIITINQNN
jgi:hypothetical protein